MAIATRLGRLFRADFNALLDQIEEPDVLLRQAIREMEEDLRGSEQQLKWLGQEKGEYVTRSQELTHEVQRLDDELTICFESGNDELARECVKRKLRGQHLLSRIQARRESTDKSIDELERKVSEQRDILEGLRQKADVFSETGDHSPIPAADGQVAITEHDVEVALLKEKKRRSQP